MVITVILSALFAFFLIVSIFQHQGQMHDKLRSRISNIIDIANIKDIDDEISKPFSERFLKPMLGKLLFSASKILPKVSNPQLQKDLQLAAINMQVGNYSALRTLSIILGGLFFILLGRSFWQSSPVMIIFFFGFGCAIVFSLFRFSLQSKVKKRRMAIRSELPDMMDLLSVSVEAGLGFDAALLKITERSKNVLSEEMIKVHREIQMGCLRRDALKGLADRTNIDEIKSFTSAIIQAEQLGISLKNVLKTQSQQLRQQRRQRAEEKAMKAPVKIMIPLVFFIFPVMFIILLAPAAINIMNAFK